MTTLYTVGKEGTGLGASPTALAHAGTRRTVDTCQRVGGRRRGTR